MNRRDFVSYTCALATVTAVGSLIRCSKDDDPDPGPGPGGGNNPRLTANLDSELTTVGSSKAQNNVIVVRTAEGNAPTSFIALTSVCTHEACTVGYQSGSNQFVCPCHGSVYSINGSVLQGPAPAPLTKYSVSINNNILTVS